MIAEHPPQSDDAQWISRRAVDDAQDAGGMWWSEWVTDHQSVLITRTFPLGRKKPGEIGLVVSPGIYTFAFHASEVRRQGAYIHARLSLRFEMTELTWGTLCIDRPDERGRLARAAWSALPPAAQGPVSVGNLVHWTDQFCAGLWDAWDQRPLPVLGTGQ